MICVDPRAGSKNLAPLFPKDLVLSFELPAADILFIDANDDSLTAIEHKKIMDLLTCIVNGRFAGTQLPAMVEAYDDYWLLVEGPMKKGRDGELLIPSHQHRDQWYQAHVGNRYFNWSDLEKWKITMQTLTPLKIYTTQGRIETMEWLMTLYDWWRQGPERHRSHMRLDKSRVSANLARASLLRRVAEQLPGIGHDKAFRVEQHFANVFEMCVADVNEWTKIEGVGEKMAGRIVEAIQYGRED